MKCPYCGHKETKVIDSRDSFESNNIRRRRECHQCLRRFTTFETIELSLQVHKRDGRYEDFQQQKLIDGLDAACRHTTISHVQVMALASNITEELYQRHQREISTTELGEIVMRRLKDLDPIAYIRFACVYKRFKNIEQLIGAIEAVQPKDDHKKDRIRGDQFMSLKKADIQKYKKILEEMRMKITGTLKESSQEAKQKDEQSGYSQHQADVGTDDFDRSIALELTGKEIAVLKQIDRALEKIEEDTYGVCDITGDEIPKPRLDAIPYATMTVKAQEQLEKGLI